METYRIIEQTMGDGLNTYLVKKNISFKECLIDILREFELNLILIYIIALVFCPILLFVMFLVSITNTLEGKFDTEKEAVDYIKKMNDNKQLEEKLRLKKLIKGSQLVGVYKV